MPEQRRPARCGVADRAAVGAEDHVRRLGTEGSGKGRRVDGGDGDQAGEGAVVAGPAAVTMARGGHVVRRGRGDGHRCVAVRVSVRLRHLRVAMRVRMRMAERRRGDAVDVADLRHRLALQPGGDGGKHRHRALQRQRGDEGPERQCGRRSGSEAARDDCQRGEAVVR